MFALTPVAGAAEPELLGTFDDWQAYTYKAPDTRVCYAVSSPKSSEAGKKVKRDPIYFLVTHMPGRIVTVKVDDKSFELFTTGDGAWVDNAAREKEILAAMKAGTKLVVTGTSWKGTETTDTYSLAGISAAVDKIDSACK
jgi:hypothetical protein